MTIENFIYDRGQAKKTNFTQEDTIITSQLSNDIVLQKIQAYLSGIVDNTNKLPAASIDALLSCQLTCICEPTIQPIYGFKELQVPSDLSTSSEATHNIVTQLSNIYKQTLNSDKSINGLSTIYQLDVWKNQFLDIDFNFFTQYNLQNSILKAADLQATLYELMNILSHIRKFKCCVYFKKTSFTGGMKMYTCFCSLQDGQIVFDPIYPPSVQAVNDALFKLALKKYNEIEQTLRNGKVTTYMPYSWRVYVSPFSKQLTVTPNYDGEHGASNSACRLFYRAGTVSNELATGLAYVKDETSDEPTFDMSSIDGSNGICTAYKLVKSQYFDLRSAIDLEKMFGIAAGKLITAERVISAITYIFELWQKNLKTIQYDIYCCHYNCHANTLGDIEEPDPGYSTYRVDIINNMNQIDGVFEYILPDNITEYYLDESAPETIEIALPIIMTSTAENTTVTANFIFEFGGTESITWNADNVPVVQSLSVDQTESGKYGNLSVTYTVSDISNIQINDLWTIQAIPAQPYTGSSVVPAIVVQTLNGTVVKDSDYTVVYTNNVDPGIANVEVIGQGDYEGSIETTFQIVNQQRNISNATITAISPQEYTGSALTPSLTVTYNETTLVDGIDYNTSYLNNTNVGTATVTITGTNSTTSGHDSYFGTKSTTFRIVKNISKSEIADIPDQTYTGSPITPTLTVEQDEQTLINGTHYTVAYTNNIEVGTATATITGIDEYFGTKSKDFNIVEAPSS